MTHLPRDKALDSTLALLSEGYGFISNRCDRYQSDIFETRIMLRKAICMRGGEAAALLYDADRFTRRQALPKPTLWLLLDKGSVNLMDDAAHKHRKRMFMALMNAAAIEGLADLMAGHWRARLEKWASMDKVVLFDEVREILCGAACEWAGIPLAPSEIALRTGQFGAMISGAGAVGPRNWRGMLRRSRTERWMRNIINRIRDGEVQPPEGSAAHIIAWHRDTDGELLDVRVAAVELINVLRPTVAVARFITFAALALHDYADCKQKLRSGGDGFLELFVQEVRRFYPFFPLVAGRARHAFDWRGQHFAEGTWVLLDIYGTNRDPRVWEEPGAFLPERFQNWDGSAFNFIPQGAGDHETGHRCAGEWLTVALMKRAVRLLTENMRYDVPEQNLEVSLSRMPAIPADRFVVTNVRQIL